MADDFKRIKQDTDIANAYREGWHDACQLHLYKPEGPPFNVAWLVSDAFAHMTDAEKRDDRWTAITDREAKS